MEFKNKQELIKTLKLDPKMEREDKFRMEYHEVAGVTLKLIQALTDLDAVKGGRGQWKKNEWKLIKEDTI